MKKLAILTILISAVGATACNRQPSTPTMTRTSIGIPDCDHYMEKYDNCLSSKVPENTRATLNAPFEQMKAQWQAQSKDPTARESLAQSCRTALDTAKQSMAAYNCEW